LLELKELAENREDVGLERAEEEINEKLPKLKIWKLRRKQAKLENQNCKLRKLRVNELYNLRYREEKDAYLINLEANKAYHNLVN
jgi:hypothetical protein